MSESAKSQVLKKHLMPPLAYIPLSALFRAIEYHVSMFELWQGHEHELIGQPLHIRASMLTGC